MGRNKSFFSLLGLWETFLSLGDSADALGGFGKLRGCFGRLWEALGMLWEALGGALGGFGDARRPPPNKKTTIYKLPINQFCWPNVIFIVDI